MRIGFESLSPVFPRVMVGIIETKGGMNTTIRIKAQEFTRNGARMYRVLNIRGVLTKDRLDPQYVGSMPSFWLTNSHKTLKLFDGTTLSVNGEYHASVFCKILNEIEKAGNRLHTLNQAKYREKRKRQTQKEARTYDVPVGEKVFKI